MSELKMRPHFARRKSCRTVPLELRPGTEFEIDIKLEPSVENVQSLCVSGQY
jgi:hypothetical protein